MYSFVKTKTLTILHSLQFEKETTQFSFKLLKTTNKEVSGFLLPLSNTAVVGNDMTN